MWYAKKKKVYHLNLCDIYENVDMENELLSEYIDNESMLHAVRGAKNRLGNALYRDGVLGGLEWHAGLVGHANGPMYNGGAWVIHHPGPDNVVEYLQNFWMEIMIRENYISLQ